MSGEVIDLNPDVEHKQLALTGEAFDIIRSLADAGAVTLTSLLIESELTYNQADALASWCGRVRQASTWWIGDLLNQLEVTHPEEFAQLSEATGLSETTRLAFQFVCSAVPVSRRKANLGFSHHSKVARLDAKEQKYWLDRASKNQWPYAALVEHMKAKRRETHPQLTGLEDTNGKVDSKLVVEVAEAILRDASEHPDDPTNYLVPVEDIVRLRAALGQEE